MWDDPEGITVPTLGTLFPLDRETEVYGANKSKSENNSTSSLVSVLASDYFLANRTDRISPDAPWCLANCKVQHAIIGSAFHPIHEAFLSFPWGISYLPPWPLGSSFQELHLLHFPCHFLVRESRLTQAVNLSVALNSWGDCVLSSSFGQGWIEWPHEMSNLQTEALHTSWVSSVLGNHDPSLQLKNQEWNSPSSRSRSQAIVYIFQARAHHRPTCGSALWPQRMLGKQSDYQNPRELLQIFPYDSNCRFIIGIFS